MVVENFTVNAAHDRSKAEPFEAGAVQWVRRPGDGDRHTLSAGFWFITPEESPEPNVVIGEADETVYIIEGHVRVQPHGGEAVDLVAGSVASFNKGVPVTWTVLEPTVEFFVYS